MEIFDIRNISSKITAKYIRKRRLDSVKNLICFFAGFIFGKLEVAAYNYFPKTGKRVTRLGEYHFHHSIQGVLLIVAGIILGRYAGKCISSFGLGILTQHTADEGLVFITKD